MENTYRVAFSRGGVSTLLEYRHLNSADALAKIRECVAQGWVLVFFDYE